MATQRTTTILAGVALAALACGAASEMREEGAMPEEVTFAPELGVDLERMTRQPSGLYTQDLRLGGGEEARPGRQVEVHYTGWLPNGRKFDSSHDRNEPFDFQLGAGRVIRGWDEGVAGMKVGGQRRLVIPPELGYGQRGAGGVIPPAATLVFDVELLDVR